MPISTDKTAHLALGATGETQALRHLTNMGFRLLHRNWRPAGNARSLELDLVGILADTLVFVEVKTRRDNEYTELGPADNFTPDKRRKIARAAGAYLQQHACWDKPCRFDLVCVTFFSDKPPKVEHYAHVIELTLNAKHTGSGAARGGNAAWQPW